MSERHTRTGFLGVFRIPERLTSYFMPWLLWLAAWPLALVIHVVMGDSLVWGAVIGVASLGLVALTWKTWEPRRKDTRWIAAGFAASVLTWVIVAASVEPWQLDILKAWGLAGVALSAGWDIRHAALSGVREVDKSQVKGENSDLLDKIHAFKGAKLGKVTETENELRTRVHLDAPNTAKDAQDARDQIAALAKVGADQVKVLKVKGDESQVDVTFTRAQDTSKPVVWPGPQHLGQSIADAPIWLGRRTDGSDILWWIVGSDDPENPRPLAHTTCTGTTGAGKTDTICTAILAMRERRDVVPIVGDPAKFMQSFGDIKDALGLAARDKDSVMNLAENLIPAVEYRAGVFGELRRSDGGIGYKQWVPEIFEMYGIPAVFIDIEEAADVAVEMGEELYEAARKLRSVGIHLCLSMQTMPHDDIPRKARGQFAQSLAHGQKEYQDAKYALDKETLEAGADPTKWRNEAPGSLYAEVVGTPREQWAIDGRAPLMRKEDRQASMQASRSHWAVLDEGTYRILSKGVAGASEQPGQQPQPAVEQEDEFTEEAVRMPLTSSDGTDITAPLAPVPGGINLDVSNPDKVRMSDEDARAEIVNRLQIMRDSGVQNVGAEDMADLPDLTGRTRNWVYGEFEALADEGLLKRINPPNTATVYRITMGDLAAVG